DGGPSRRAAYWPFAEFSPEWQAMRWALEAGVPVRFCDLPASVSLASRHSHASDGEDPIGALARAGGYDDPERWWEDVVEHRLPDSVDDDVDLALAPFQAVAEAMAAVRPPRPAEPEPTEEERREAH